MDPREVTVGWSSSGASVLLRWPTATLDLTRVHLANFSAGAGLVGTLAVLSSHAPQVAVLETVG